MYGTTQFEVKKNQLQPLPLVHTEGAINRALQRLEQLKSMFDDDDDIDAAIFYKGMTHMDLARVLSHIVKYGYDGSEKKQLLEKFIIQLPNFDQLE